MRLALLALCLSLGTSATAFEIEATRTYAANPVRHSLRILSTADIEIFEPLIEAFQIENIGVEILYDVASSTQVMQAIHQDAIDYDLVISSAMDLQIKLANDGFAQVHRSPEVDALPNWANWRDEVFGFTAEPAVLVISKDAFEGMEIPQNRRDLISLMRSNPSAFEQQIGTYDARTSGLGYLFATQDARNTETYWQLTEVMGGLNAQLYCCSNEMISDVVNGHLAVAYNVLGSYARARVAETPSLMIIEMDDYISVMMRTVLIPKNSENPQIAGDMIDFLLSARAKPILRNVGLPPVVDGADQTPLRTIRLGPGLLVFLDQLRRETFLRNWTGSILQNE